MLALTHIEIILLISLRNEEWWCRCVLLWLWWCHGMILYRFQTIITTGGCYQSQEACSRCNGIVRTNQHVPRERLESRWLFMLLNYSCSTFKVSHKEWMIGLHSTNASWTRLLMQHQVISWKGIKSSPVICFSSTISTTGNWTCMIYFLFYQSWCSKSSPWITLFLLLCRNEKTILDFISVDLIWFDFTCQDFTCLHL